MAIDKVTSASITTDAVGPTQLNEASNYDFTGTVTGAGITGLGVINHFKLGSTKSIAANTATVIDTWNSSPSYGNGSNFTMSSGEFTAPSTGYYYVSCNLACYKAAGTFIRYVHTALQVYNGSSWSDIAHSQNFIGSDGSNNRWHETTTFGIIDVTNTSTNKIRFNQSSEIAHDIETGTTTAAVFIKLAET